MLPIGSVAFLLAFFACSDGMDRMRQNEVEWITMFAPDFEIEGESRTSFQITGAGAEFSWTANDTVGIFPNEGAQAYFPMTSGAGTKTANFTGGGWALKDASTYAAYYPFVGDFYLDRRAVPVDYTGQVQDGDASTAHLGKHDYMAAAPLAPTEGNVVFAFKHLGVLVQLKLTLPQAASLTSVSLTDGEDVFAVKGKVDLTSAAPEIEPDGLSDNVELQLKNTATKEAGQTVTLYLMLPPCDLSEHSLDVTIKDVDGNEYTAALIGKDMVAGKAYAYEASATVSDGVTDVMLVSAGTLLDAIGGYDNLRNIEKLKIAGDINGDDVYEIRRMANLKYLNLKDAHIVKGGRAYYDEYTTEEGKIGAFMFYGMEKLEEVILPVDITGIGSIAFKDCSLCNVILQEGVKTIGEEVFCWAKKMLSINLPQSLETIGGSAFRFSGLQHVTIPSNVTSIGRNAFAGCKLESIHIKAHPATLKDIGDNAFGDSYETATLYIPKGTRDEYIHTELGRFVNIVEE